MKTLAAKLFLVVMAATALSAAAMAETGSYGSFAEGYTVSSNGGSLGSSFIGNANNTVIASALSADGSQAKCYIEWADKKRGKIRLQIKCPTHQK